MSTIDRKPHRFCTMLRELSADEWIELLDSYEAHGPRDAVIVVDQNGDIVDGWHSYQALKHFNIDPEPYVRMREFRDDTEVGEYIIARQLGRRNNTAVENIAMANAILGDAAKSGEPVRQVRRWRRIQASGVVPLQQAVQQRRVSLVDGEALAMLAESAQLDALRGGELAVRAAVEQVRAAKAKSGPPPSVAKADPLAAAQDALGALNGVELAKLMRRYKPSLAATWEQAPKAEKDALLARVKLASGPAPALPDRDSRSPARKLNGGQPAESVMTEEFMAAMRAMPIEQFTEQLVTAINRMPPGERKELKEGVFDDVMRKPVEEGGFGGDRMLFDDYLWYCVLDQNAHPAMRDERMARARDEKLFGTLDPKQHLINIERMRNTMPHNKDVAELCDSALAALGAAERHQSGRGKRLDGFLRAHGHAVPSAGGAVLAALAR